MYVVPLVLQNKLMKKIVLSYVLAFVSVAALSQTDANYTKLSSRLAEMMHEYSQKSYQKAREDAPLSYVLALVKLADTEQDDAVFAEYDCKVAEQVGRIYIVNIPWGRLAALSVDQRVIRIEAERMPRPAMDKTHGYINSTDVYSGINLPQAYSGKGVVAGVFDTYYDFTHPAFFDENGQSRIKYYYDMLWKNADGTYGHGIEDSDEIVALKHSQNTYNHTHGTHVASTMAGSSVNGKYQGMAPQSDIYLVDFNSERQDFENPNAHTSATAVLGFKYIFDKAAAEGKPCVVNFSSCESITLSRQRILEGEALQELVGPGRIIVAACGNMGMNIPYMEKPATMHQAGAAITNGIGGGAIIDMDIVTPDNQYVRIDFWGFKLSESTVESTLTFHTDSVKLLNGDTCVLRTKVSAGDIVLKIYKSTYIDERGDVFHIDGTMPHVLYLMYYGASILLTGDSPAWLYSDLFLSPFANISGVPEYNLLAHGYSVAWPATLPFVVAVGATGYHSTYTNMFGTVNNELDVMLPDSVGHIAQFSSLGPTFDGLIKPDVVAPGMYINAAHNSFSTTFEDDKKWLTEKVLHNGKSYYYMAQSGTSMASPIVAGAIALWLEANPKLTPDDILDIIAKSATKPEAELDYPNNTYGYGQIDVYKGLLHALDVKTAIPNIYDYQPSQARFVLENGILRVLFIEDNMPDDDVQLSIYGINGMLVQTVKGRTANISHLPNGVYAVQLQTSNVKTSGSTLIRL